MVKYITFFPPRWPLFLFFSSAELISPAYDILNVFLIFPVDSSRPPYSRCLPDSWAEYFISSAYSHSSGNSNDNHNSNFLCFFLEFWVALFLQKGHIDFYLLFHKDNNSKEKRWMARVVYVHRGVWCRRPRFAPIIGLVLNSQNALSTYHLCSTAKSRSAKESFDCGFQKVKQDKVSAVAEDVMYRWEWLGFPQ